MRGMLEPECVGQDGVSRGRPAGSTGSTLTKPSSRSRRWNAGVPQPFPSGGAVACARKVPVSTCDHSAGAQLVCGRGD